MAIAQDYVEACNVLPISPKALIYRVAACRTYFMPAAIEIEIPLVKLISY
jgi:hypothetical protein